MRAPDGFPSLRQRLSDGERVLGGFVRSPAEDLIEMLGVAGLDFVILDCEHGAADTATLRHHVALGELHGMSVLVRVGQGERTLVQRALDQGAHGIVAPHIDTRAEAEDLVRSVRYPPEGDRGLATYTRAGGFGSVPADVHRRRALESTLVIAMIESPGGVRRAGEILSCPGVDGFLVGTSDLGASSGPTDPALTESVTAVRRCGEAIGSFRADLANDAASARTSFDDGAHLVVYNFTHAMMELFRGLAMARKGSAR